MLNRRHFLQTTAGAGATAALLPGFTRDAHAAIDQVQFFVPANPGGGWDQTARSMEQALKSANLIKGAQVTNVGGAGGAVGLPQFVNQWKGRGNALMVAGMVMVGALITNKSPVKVTQTVPIARLTGEYEVIVVPAESPHKTLKDLMAAFKADPTKVSWAGGSAGGTDHILAGMLAKASGGDAKKVSYVAYSGGGPALAALLGNQVTCGVSGWGEFSEQVKAGKLRALAISADKHQAGIDVPTIKESGFDVDLVNWRGVFAPPGIKDADKKALIDLVGKMRDSAPWKEQLKAREWTDVFLAGDAYGKYIEAENKRIEGILKDLGLA
ncbi:tripartite tricarboxylate transporter substrate binding protein [Ferrovibrio sp.]|uniref:Bug family tripartite tricarboxylate transporter substrate binding protein n=1 Tax=Ferrovibrio sp. TaxID=1917215 RepID=UPI000CB68E37|nr:tripartite tricarboxylate transporter substrate-binding protein [Ferrovibrio sp.]PJI37661.1 MAG: C4-dicarboxylate ABC transporter substrate-binding protein [Ferrovibrio sp.]